MSTANDLHLDAIPDDGATETLFDSPNGSGSVVVIRRGEQVFAYRNVCPHAGRLLNWAPGRFLFDKGRLVCAAHGAVFEVESGLCVEGPCRGSSLEAVGCRVSADRRVELHD
jgi:nitrite reductase/ring-hydroxylating ferredoxin subunit